MSAARAEAGGEPALGIIGGSGLYEMEGIEDLRWVRVRTPFGDPSDAYCTGRLGDRRVIFLPRHGRGHRVTPSEINYRANIYGLKALGARWIISVSAVGSMKEEIHPLDLVDPRPVLRPHQAPRLDLLRRRHRRPRRHGRAGLPGAGRPARDREPGGGRAGAPRRHLHLHRGAAVLHQGRVADLPPAGACR